MAVTNVISTGSGVSGAISGTQSQSAKRTYTSSWQAKCNSPADTSATVIDYFRRNGSLPFIGRAYAFGNDVDFSSRCTSLDCSLIPRSDGIWTVSAKYEPPEGNEEEEQGKDPDGRESPNPLDWRDEISIDFTQISIPVEGAVFKGSNRGGRNGTSMRVRRVDSYGPVINSAGVPFDPGIDEELDIKIVRITKNVREFNGSAANRWIGCVNSRQVNVVKRAYSFRDTWGPLTARIKNISGSFQMANGIPYWKQTIEVHVSPLGWRRFIVDRGTDRRQMPGDIFFVNNKGEEISAGDIKPGDPGFTKIVGPDGYPITVPVLLDGDGQPAVQGTPAIYLEYQTYEERSFSSIKW